LDNVYAEITQAFDVFNQQPDSFHRWSSLERQCRILAIAERVEGSKVYFDNKIDKKNPTPINTGLSERKIREYNLFESLPLRQSL
tara:strand:+ start:505 stop:759 length:255 start_codon:yes stop_codon:yes gene_type:complete